MSSTPLDVFVCNAAPALSADRKFFAFKINVEPDVLALTLMLPRVSTPFQILRHSNIPSGEIAFKEHVETAP
jgi:hypothetical protein